MDRPFTIKSKDMDKPLTLEQMQRFFKGGKKDVIDEINRKSNELTNDTNTKDNQCYIDKLGFSCGVEDVKYYEKITSLKEEQEQVLKTVGFLKNYANITLEEQIKAEIEKYVQEVFPYHIGMEYVYETAYRVIADEDSDEGLQLHPESARGICRVESTKVCVSQVDHFYVRVVLVDVNTGFRWVDYCSQKGVFKNKSLKLRQFEGNTIG
jgi:hypothetical protein